MKTKRSAALAVVEWTRGPKRVSQNEYPVTPLFTSRRHDTLVYH